MGSTITVDSALSMTSENPVQNKVIKAALDGKLDASRVDVPLGQNKTILCVNNAGIIKSAEKLSDGTWKITLTLKMHKEYPAGTKVRLHANGGYQYVSIFDLTDTNWKSTRGTVKGMVKTGMGGRMWTPGTAFANIVIFTNNNTPIQFRNIKLEVKD